MVAHIFARHGCWEGTCRPPNDLNPRGFHENRDITKVIQAAVGHLNNYVDRDPVFPPGIDSSIVEAVLKDGYSGGPWIYKQTALYHQAFAEMDPFMVTVRRPLPSMLASNHAAKIMRVVSQDYEKILQRHVEVLDELEAKGAMRVDTPRIIDGDYGQLEAVIDACGLKFDRSAVEQVVFPSLWHF